MTAEDGRCPGSERAPARVNRCGRQQCQVCGRRFAPKLNGMVRRHGWEGYAAIIARLRGNVSKSEIATS